MSDKTALPPLPESQANGDNTTDYSGRLFEYTAEQMHDYARAVLAASADRRDAVEWLLHHSIDDSRTMFCTDKASMERYTENGEWVVSQAYSAAIAAAGKQQANTEQSE